MKYSSARNGTRRRLTRRSVRVCTESMAVTATAAPMMTHVSTAAEPAPPSCFPGRSLVSRQRPKTPHRGGVILRAMRALLATALLLLTLTMTGRSQAPRPLEVYWIDVEGGAATLIVTPAREAVL